jgi:predicted secreted protein
MTWTSIIAIYLLFWVMTAFVILPIGVRTHDELGLPKVPGQADSAPGNFQPRIIILRTTLLSAALFALYYANYVYGWVDRHSLTG